MSLVKIRYSKTLYRNSPFDEEKEVSRTKTLVLPAGLAARWLGQFSDIEYDDENCVFRAKLNNVIIRSVCTVFGHKLAFLGYTEPGQMEPDWMVRQRVMREIFRPILKKKRFGRIRNLTLSMPSDQVITWKAEQKALPSGILDGEFTVVSL